MATTSAEPAQRIERVSTLELFFDLVFVFTLTELTDTLTDEPTGTGLARVALLLAVIWWMYGGYAWLTNAVRADRLGRQALLLGGMGAFFVVALAVPEAFTDPGPAFGLAYLALVAVHAGLFVRGAPGSVAVAMLRIGSFNVLAAAAVLAGLWIGGAAAYVGLGLATVLLWALPFLRPLEAFDVGARHFVERHGLIVIIAIGESIVAVGVGVREQELDLRLIVAALLGLLISAGLWWTYFGRERDEEVEQRLAAVAPERRGRAALDAFGLWHYALLLGIVLLAAGLKKAVGDPSEPLSAAGALFLTGGLALFLVADLGFRHALGIPLRGVAVRGVALLVLAVSVPVGTEIAAELQLVLVTAALTAVCVVEARAGGDVDRSALAPG